MIQFVVEVEFNLLTVVELNKTVVALGKVLVLILAEKLVVTDCPLKVLLEVEMELNKLVKSTEFELDTLSDRLVVVCR